ncbi:MAG: hypothetical protein Q7K26_01330 [bacterium]|nr:hypothetical protein [bacterium]
MDVKKITIKHLTENGFDGLFSDECGCKIDDLFPCGVAGVECCQPGYEQLETPQDFDFAIGSEKRFAKTLKVEYDQENRVFNCSGLSHEFIGYFAGTGDSRVVESEVFAANGNLIDVLEFPAPGEAIPSVEEIAASFSKKLPSMRDERGSNA